MERISPMMLYPLILACGILQAWGPPMNGALRNALTNPWLATLISFVPISFLFATAWFCIPSPLPTVQGINQMPWWAPLGGIIGSFAVVAGLLFVDKVGAGAFAGLTITANIWMSLFIDQFGMFRMPVHHFNLWRIIGGLLMAGGMALIALF
jgi:transporter family-2 protein